MKMSVLREGGCRKFLSRYGPWAAIIRVIIPPQLHPTTTPHFLFLIPRIMQLIQSFSILNSLNVFINIYFLICVDIYCNVSVDIYT